MLRADSKYTYGSSQTGTEFLLSLSAGYKFTGIGLGIYADFASGLNDRYITLSASDEETHIGNHDVAIPMYAVGKVS